MTKASSQMCERKRVSHMSEYLLPFCVAVLLKEVQGMTNIKENLILVFGLYGKMMKIDIRSPNQKSHKVCSLKYVKECKYIPCKYIKVDYYVSLLGSTLCVYIYIKDMIILSPLITCYLSLGLIVKT